jgi:tetratricopeptide (TPR) repeat protein
MTRKVAAAAAALFLFAACATAPAAPKAPAWIFETPKPDATYTYFVGTSSDAKGDQATATNDAAANLIASIMQAVGVSVSVKTEGEAKATLDSYQANLKQTVTTEANNRLSGFQVKQKFVEKDKKSGRVTVYVLAAYVTADLQAEKKRIKDMLDAYEKAVSVPESAGLAYLQEGRAYEAVRKFVEAAVAASGANIDNADQKMERNINSARTALSRIRFDKGGKESYKALVGQPFPEPFKLRLVSGEAAGSPGVPGATLQVSYQRKQGTRLTSKTEPAMTDPSGTLSFLPPAPDFVGKAKLQVKVDFQSSIDLLDKLPPKFAAYREALAEELKNKFVEIPYEVSSNAKNVPTGVAIVDLDEAGQPVAGAQAQAGLVDALAKEKFVVKSLAIDPAALSSMDEAAAINAAKAAGLARVAFGSVRIDSIRKDGGNFITSAKAQVKVLDVATGQILYSAEKGASGFGADEQSARRAVYRDLGANAIGKDLLASLP